MVAINPELRESILRLAQQHGVTEVRVFGSFARGEQRADSDMDFLIKAGPDTPPWFPGGLVVDLEELLGRPVDVVTEDALHPLLRDRILREAVPL